jgi:serine/threonine protein kinase
MKKYSKYHILKNGKEKSLIRSSRILQVLEHKNIIRFLYYAIDDEKDEIFLVFEACKKGSL